MRQPIVAGRFYSGSERGCRQQIARVDSLPADGQLPEHLVAAVVPHAGWDFSGHVAMKVFNTVRERWTEGMTFVIFGAVHSFGVARASVFDRGAWQTPLGPLMVDEALATLLVSKSDGLLIADSVPHLSEHSIEVQLPMLKYVFGDCQIVPIAAPPRADSHEMGRRAARIAREAGRPIFVLGTTDLTHYGAAGYNFAPRGSGRAALEWVKNENDARIIGLMRDLKADQIVAEAARSHNACGAGAVAATVAAACELGSAGGHLIEYTTSYDVMRDTIYGDNVGDFVGYAGMVF